MNEAVHILLVEDNEDDGFVFTLAARRSRLKVSIHTVMSCRGAIDYLEAHGEYADRQKYPIPDLLVLDLMMPGMDGLAFLAWRKNNPWALAVPAVAFSGQTSDEWRTRALAAGANGFLPKPFELEQWPAAIREACRLAGLSVESKGESASDQRQAA